MGVDRLNSRFDRGGGAAVIGAKGTLKAMFDPTFIKYLRKADKAGKWESELMEWKAVVDRGGALLEWQYDAIDKRYERCMEAAGLPRAPVREDQRRRGMRFGR